MIRNLLATTALATLLATGAYAQEAQDSTTPAQPADQSQQVQPAQVSPAEGHLATKLIGEAVYNGTGNEAEKVGEVNDMVVSDAGNVDAIVVGVGGFLGIGEKNVAIKFDEVKWSEGEGDRWLIINASKEQLEQMAEFDRSAYDEAPAVAANDQAAPAGGAVTTAPAPATTDTTADNAQQPADQEQTAQQPADQQPADQQQAAQQPAEDDTETVVVTPTEEPADQQQAAQQPADQQATDQQQAAQDTTTTTVPADQNAAGTDATQTAAIDRSTLKELNTGDIRSEDLVGTTVYGANDENVGEIGDVVLTADGKVDAVIIDVGGFLGIGEKEVAVGMDNLHFMTDGNGNTYLYTNFNKEQLEAATEYDESTYAQNRDQQRIILSE